MLLLIDIPEVIYKNIKDDYIGVFDFKPLIDAIQKGQIILNDSEILTKEAYADLCNKAAGIKESEEDMNINDIDWIPCTVALPEKSDLYLVTWRGRYGSLEPHNWIELIEYTAADGDRKEAYGWETYELEKTHNDVEVLAWMEAPETYQGRED